MSSMTRPADAVWTDPGHGYRRWEKSVLLGAGEVVWRWATAEVLRWGVTATRGSRPVIMAHAFGLSVPEPVEVIDVVQTPERVGFAYRTLPGHPVSGEEAFIVHRDGDTVRLTIRSLTKPGSALHWRLAYPGLLVAQNVARRRYLRALRVRAAR